jgi:hypothetical protein
MSDTKYHIILLSLTILAVFLYALIPINDFDFWWHLETGDWIIEHERLPDADPFSYTSLKDDPEAPGRPDFVLRQYWLAQVLFSLIVRFLGLQGFIILRAVVFTLTAIFSLLLIRHYRANMVGTITLPLLALVTTECLTDRPQMFSFLLATMVFYLLESGIEKKQYLLFIIPPLMLLWANIHAGFLVGIIFILVYLAMIPFEERIRGVRRTLIPVAILSIALTYLNPTHWEAIKRVFVFYRGGLLLRETLEYHSPFKIIPYTMDNPGWLSYWAIVLLTVFSAILLIRNRTWSRFIILTGTLCASLISMRFTYFFAPVAVPLISSSLKNMTDVKVKDQGSKIHDLRLVIPKVFLLIGVSLLIFIYSRMDLPDLLKSETAYGYFPEQAAEYIISRPIPSPIFNDVNWGGYLIWKLWPNYRVFIDTRTLNVDTYRQYISVINNYTGEGRFILEAYGIKSIITPAINPYTGEIFPFVRALYRDDNWALIYLDGVAMIFVKDEYAKQRLPKSAIYEEVLYEANFWWPVFPQMPGYKKTIEEAYRILNK